MTRRSDACTGYLLTCLCLLSVVMLCCGCGSLTKSKSAAEHPLLPNPLEIAVTDHDFVWNQLVDTIDDYFPIAREERVRTIGTVMTEGRIETQPTTGATAMQIFRRDQTPGFEKWHGTFQSIRRQAEVRVLPGQNGYGINVIVRKELEDVDRPEMSMVGSTVQRHDGSLIRPQGAHVGGAVSLGWIPLGRDIALEQKILADIYARFHHVETPLPVESMSHSP